MHDLSTIQKLNVEAFLEGAEKARSEGKHVLVTYDGLHVTGFETFSDEGEAMAQLQNSQANADPSQRFTMLLPAVEGRPAVNIEFDRPQLLDGEPNDPAIEQQAELTPEEEGELSNAVMQRDRALNALQAAAFAFAKAQEKCTHLGEDLRARMEARARELQPQLFQ